MRKSDEKINFIIGKTMIVTEDSPLKALQQFKYDCAYKLIRCSTFQGKYNVIVKQKMKIIIL